LHGQPLRRNNFISKLFKPLLKRAGLPDVRPYDLRHTSATLLLAAGVNIRVISERLGHESIEITLKHYAHCLPCMQEKAVEAVEALFGAIGTKSARTEDCGDYVI
jgi:integrase